MCVIAGRIGAAAPGLRFLSDVRIQLYHVAVGVADEGTRWEIGIGNSPETEERRTRTARNVVSRPSEPGFPPTVGHTT